MKVSKERIASKRNRTFSCNVDQLRNIEHFSIRPFHQQNLLSAIAQPTHLRIQFDDDPLGRARLRFH